MYLTLLIFIPLVIGVLAAALLPARQVKWAALAAMVLDLGLALLLAGGVLGGFDWNHDPKAEGAESAWVFGSEIAEPQFQLREHVPWPMLQEYEISYSLGVDNLSMLLILLTAALGIFAVLCSWTAIREREKEFYLYLLALQTGILGIFCALDLILFFMAWEVMMLPLYFLIGIFGSSNRLYATMKFVLYSLTGSLMMLLSIIWIYYNSGISTFSFEKLEVAGITFHQSLPFLGMMLAFLVKVPLWPFHTWLPDAHTEAPTAGSVILAGVLLKTGIFGILRFAIPLFPIPAVAFAPVFSWLAVIAIVYGAMCAIVQTDMKRLVAYSSVSHMGFIVLGIFCFNAQAMNGAILQMFNHGISTGGLFLAVGMIYERRHTRKMSEFGGLAHTVPVYAALTMVMVLSSVGLPGLNGFAGEFPILLGSMHNVPMLIEARDASSLYASINQVNYTWLVAALATMGVILGAVYLLIMYQKVFFGKLDKEENKNLVDLDVREWGQLAVLSVAALVIGLYPQLLMKPIGKTTDAVLAMVAGPLHFDVGHPNVELPPVQAEAPADSQTNEDVAH